MACGQVVVYANDGTSLTGWVRSTTGGAGALLDTATEPGFITWNPGADVNNMHLLRYFPESTLANIGDSITLTTSYKVTGINAGNASNHRLRIGLFHSGGVKVGEPHGPTNPVFTNYNGYFGTYAAPADRTLVQLNQKLQPHEGLIVQALGGTFSESLGSTTKSGGLTDGTVYTATLTVTRSASGNDIAFAQTGGADWSLPVSDTGGLQGPFYTFDTLVFGVLDASTSVLTDWRFDDLQVVYTPAGGGGLTPTTTAIVSSRNPSSLGESVSFTATVTPNPGSGTVQFRTNGVAFGVAVALSGGRATSLATTNLPAGTTTVSAEFTGNDTHLPSSNSLRQVVTAAPTRPNFIFMITDDQRWDAVGVVQQELAATGRARFSWFANQTPGLDRLAREGVRFRNAFVVNSVCSPSRACFLTGQYNHLNSVAHNGKEFPPTAVTYASLLSAAGYTTIYTGKWHMSNQSARPGFTQFASYLGQGNYHNQLFTVNGVDTPTTGWIDDVTTDFALQFLTNHAANPFVLVVGYKSPHDPKTPRANLNNLYTGLPILPPVNGIQYPPPYLPNPGGGPSDGQIRDYLECLKGVDENVERILNTLDGLNLAGNTMVVFTSDNGYLFREHGLGDKRAAYEESLRIPLLVRYPPLGMSNVLRDEVVLNLDLAPTFLDFAGEPIPASMQGRSWRPLLENNPPADWRRSWLYEYTKDLGVPTTPTIVALRSPDTKLILYPVNPGYTELYDLATDPFETNNLAFHPAAQSFLAGALEQLAAEMRAAGYQPSLLNFSRAANSTSLQVTAGYGLAYLLESSSNLTHWSTVSSYNYVNLSTDLTKSFTDNGVTAPQLFYRVRQVERQ